MLLKYHLKHSGVATLICTVSVARADYYCIHIIQAGNSSFLVNKIFCSPQLSFCMGVQNCMKQVKFVWLPNEILKCYPWKFVFLMVCYSYSISVYAAWSVFILRLLTCLMCIVIQILFCEILVTLTWVLHPVCVSMCQYVPVWIPTDSSYELTKSHICKHWRHDPGQVITLIPSEIK